MYVKHYKVKFELRVLCSARREESKVQILRHYQSINLYLKQATWPIRQTRVTDTYASIQNIKKIYTTKKKKRNKNTKTKINMAYMHATWTPLSCCNTAIVYGKYT